jgi:hypothetical protein
MTGYTRQSVADIINGLDVTAPPLNSEFNQLQAAFDGTTGHSHDGSQGAAPPIPLATSVSGFLPAAHGGVGGKNNTTATANPVVTNDNTEAYAPGSLWLNNNTGRVFICVGNNTGAAVWREVAVITENDVFFPETNDTVDLGTAANRFKALYLSGNIDAQGNLTLGGAATITGNASVGGNLSVAGTSTLATVDINAGNIDGTTVGGSSPAQGTFTNLTANTLLTAASVDINGGNIDGTTIGNVTPAAGSFSTVDIDGGTIDGATIGATNPSTATFSSVDINGGNIDGTTIGASNATSATFTTANAGQANLSSVNIDGGSIDSTAIGSGSPDSASFNGLTASGTVNFSSATVSNLGTVTTADINGGTIDGVTIGANSAVAEINVDNLKLNGNSLTSTDLNGNINLTPNGSGDVVISKADINDGSIDGTVIGSSAPAAGNFTTVSTTGQATLNSADINGGTIDGTTIGGSSTAAGSFTTLSASSGITGDLTGDVTGNVTGNVTGDLTGNVTGDLTGDVTSSGTSVFNNVTISGSLNMDAGTASTIVNLTDPTNAQDAATKAYVDSEISALIDGAPATLDTLNEIAAALADDQNAFTTLDNKINTKVSKAGDTMTGDLSMGTNKVTSSAPPSAGSDLTNKTYVDAQRDTRVAKTGDSMSGNLDMGSNKVTGLAAPTNANDATRKSYVDDILGSATEAATSASEAATSASEAANSASAASTSETNAANSAAAAAASYDDFDDRYLGPKSTAPTTDNDGNALQIGALYFDTTTDTMRVFSSAGWIAAGSSVNGTSARFEYTATNGQTTFSGLDDNNNSLAYDAGFVDVYLNGVRLIDGTDFTATSGTSIQLNTGANTGDVLSVVAFGTFTLSNQSLNDLTDASTGGVTDSDLLVYSSANGQFEPSKSVAITGGSITGTDVDVSGATFTVAADQISGDAINGGTATPTTVNTTNLNVDSGTLFVDSANNRVGVGTSSPSFPLEVVSNSDKIQFIPSSRQIKTEGGNSVLDSTDGDWIFEISNSEAARIDSSGNVGVGNTFPSSFNSFANNLVVGTGNGSQGITVYGGTSSNLSFADGPDGAQSFAGYINYVHSTDDLQFYVNYESNSSDAAKINANHDFQFNSGFGSAATAYGCRAWVNFDGTGTVSIRDSGNVSSITDNGTGIYTVNFTTAMPDNDYCAFGSSLGDTSTSSRIRSFASSNQEGMGTTFCGLVLFDVASDNPQDRTHVNFMLVR